MAIVGVGLSGLSLALFLQKKDSTESIQLFDRHLELASAGVETTVGVLFQRCFIEASICSNMIEEDH